ncbi:MAG: hypothetical protein QM528_03935 [Phycisphaerales bacterium]|nr:hypothetical protein [Phycisphaerales bacterium]
MKQKLSQLGYTLTRIEIKKLNGGDGTWCAEYNDCTKVCSWVTSNQCDANHTPKCYLCYYNFCHYYDVDNIARYC